MSHRKEYRPYSKSKLELNSKSRTRVMQKISSVFLSIYFVLEAKLQILEFEFCQIKLRWNHRKKKLAINWQNFAQVELELKFALK